MPTSDSAVVGSRDNMLPVKEDDRTDRSSVSVELV